MIYEQQMFPHNFSEPNMFKNRPPDGIWEHFLYHSESFWAVRFTGALPIFREGQKFKKIGLNKK